MATRTPANIFGPNIRNYWINGALDFWQRGTSFSVGTGAYTADRLTYENNGSGATISISRQAFAVGAAPFPDLKYFARWAQTVAGSAATAQGLVHKIEKVSILAGSTATLSFWAKADAARSVTVNISQNFGTGGSPSATALAGTSTISLTTSWQRFSVTVSLPSISGKTLGTSNNDYILIEILGPNNTVCTLDYAGFCFNEGLAPMNFRRAGGDLGAELSLCQRYYEKTYDVDTAPGTVANLGAVLIRAPFATAGTFQDTRFKTLKRTIPTLTAYSPNSGSAGYVFDLSSGTDKSASQGTISSSGFWWGQNDSVNVPDAIGMHYTADAEL